MLILATAASLFVVAVRLLFHYSEFVFRSSERLLPYDFWMYYIIIERLYWNDYICLMRIDCCDDLMSNVHNGTVTYVNTHDIANKSLDFDMTLGYYVICGWN